MLKTHLNLFVDTSVVFAAILSKTGGARKLFRLGELGVVNIQAGPNVLRECEAVVRRKAPTTLPTLAILLEACGLEQTPAPGSSDHERASALVAYGPDAIILAEALTAGPDWFVTHDKAHFLKPKLDSQLPFRIGTPGDVIEFLGTYLTQL
ncbi:MAG: PIN domain-containing protein [Chloroflexota bacterium]|nr:PIN domain-containing protein [Chloroflexota bacterium]